MFNISCLELFIGFLTDLSLIDFRLVKRVFTDCCSAVLIANGSIKLWVNA